MEKMWTFLLLGSLVGLGRGQRLKVSTPQSAMNDGGICLDQQDVRAGVQICLVSRIRICSISRATLS